METAAAAGSFRLVGIGHNGNEILAVGGVARERALEVLVLMLNSRALATCRMVEEATDSETTGNLTVLIGRLSLNCKEFSYTDGRCSIGNHRHQGRTCL